LESFWKTGCTA